jgi:Ca2+-transporting ATPase
MQVPATRPDWHALPPAEVASQLGTDHRGLAAAEVAARQQRYGPNQLAEPPAPSALVVLFRQFRSPLIYILIAAAAVTTALGDYLDAAVIAAVLAINATVGFVQERKADHAVRALAQMVVPRTRVVRDGQEREIDSRALVPGDAVLLEQGGRVTADLRLTTATGLRLDESLLTGESTPVPKRVTAAPARAALPDRHGMAYTGAVVTGGRGRGVVVATGEHTELGAIAGLIRGEREVATPLQQRMSRFARLIGIAVGIAVLVVFGSGMALGGTAHDMFLASVALAVAAVPEGLPIAVTVTLALGVHRMARRNAIVRRLPAVETLGSTTVIGSDKTGTLTENRMTVRELWAGGQLHQPGGTVPPGSPVHQALLAGVLTNEATAYLTDDGVSSTGDPTEVALLVAAMRARIIPDEVRGEYDLYAEIPFESERRYSASVRTRNGAHQLFVKGAPERVLAMAGRMLTADGAAPLDPPQVAQAAAALAGRGLRVLAVAAAPVPEPPDPDDLLELVEPQQLAELGGLVLLGLVGMQDPPRPGVARAVADCQSAGIRVVMITGDHAATARAIAADLGISGPDDPALTGEQLADLDDAELRRLVPRIQVYARVTPADKLRVVHALQQHGEVVAVTGDGVNDAPALKAAAIGVAMGRGGTDVAREAADMVLADDNFVSLAAAVEQGRITFDNVRKVTFFLVSTGAATILAIAAGIWLGWPLLMLPAQLLWLNLVTNGLQDVALAFEPGGKRVLQRPPRPAREGILSRTLWWRTALVGAVMAAGALLLFRWELDRTGSLTYAQTVALTAMVVFMALHVGNARAETRSLLQVSPLANRFLLLATVAALTVHVAALYAPPTQWLLRVEPIDAGSWLRILVVALSVPLVVELDKLLRRRAAGTRPRPRSTIPT